MSKRQHENGSGKESDEELPGNKSQDKNNEKRLLKCAICSKQYTNSKSWKQHMQSHLKKRRCEICKVKSYTRLENLYLHQAKVHGIHREKKQKLSRFPCSICGKVFCKNFHLTRHMRMHERTSQPPLRRTQFSCRHCDCDFDNYGRLINHIEQNHPLNQQGGRQATVPPRLNTGERRLANLSSENNAHNASAPTDKIGNNGGEEQQPIEPPIEEDTALANGVVNRYIHPRRSERYDMMTFFSNIRDRVFNFIQSRARKLGGVKWNLCVQVEMQRDDVNEVATTSPYFRSRTYTTLQSNDVSEHDLNEALQKMYAGMEKFMREGSGWYLKKVIKLEIQTVVYKPLRGSTYLPLPTSLALNRSLLNIQNQDEKCFLYCLLASLHPITREPELVEHYHQYMHEVNMSGITYPVTLPQIQRVESLNESISINVFAYEQETIVPLRITERTQREHHVNLLWLTYEGKSHYCLIKDFNRFLSRTNKHSSQVYFCPYCLHGFYRETSLQEHKIYCSRHGVQRIELPVKGENDLLEFRDFEKTLKVPFVIYADLETIVRKLDTCQPNPDKSACTPLTKLDVCGFGYKVVCQDERYTKQSVIYRGKDAGKHLIECLLQEAEAIKKILSKIVPMDMTSKEHEEFIEKATQCCLCKKRFQTHDKKCDRIVRHHDHLTGKIIGAACNACNLRCRQATFIPVLFHNLQRFDAHPISQYLGHFKKYNLKCIPRNTENYYRSSPFYR